MDMYRWNAVMQRGENPEALPGVKKEAEVKRAAAASKSTKTFYKVTVKVNVVFACATLPLHFAPLCLGLQGTVHHLCITEVL